MHTRGPMQRHGVTRPLLAVLLVACAGALVLVGAVVATARPTPTLGPQLACADVASSVGLRFTGDYGPVLPAPDALRHADAAEHGQRRGGRRLRRRRLPRRAPARAGRAADEAVPQRSRPGGGRRFTDVTDAAGLGGITSNARVAQFVDLSGSGRPDLVIAADYMPGGPGGPSQILRNDGDGTFTDVTAGSGFDPEGYIVGGMTFADYDGTGRQSIYLSYWTEELAGDPARQTLKGAFPGQNRLYRNLGDYHFEDVTYPSGIGEYHADSFTAVFADFTGDALPDLYQANDHRPDRFYQNQGGGTFKDTGYAAGLTRAGNSMGVATAVGPDGTLQLYVTNITDPSGLFGSNLGNTFMVSERDPSGIRFHNVAAQSRRPRHRMGLGHRVRGHEPRRRARPVRRPGHARVRRRRQRASRERDLQPVPRGRRRHRLQRGEGHGLRRARRPAGARGLRLRPGRLAGPPDHPGRRADRPAPELHRREALADGRPGRPRRRRHRCARHA